MKTPTIWKKLIINQQKIITTPEIQKLGKQINKDEWRSIDYLQRHGYIYRILRGIFYIRDPEERERDFFKAAEVAESVFQATEPINPLAWIIRFTWHMSCEGMISFKVFRSS